MYKILIADDHPLFRDAITHVIGSHFVGSEIIEKENLESTLELARIDKELDLILLDLNMPGMQGLNGLISLRNEAPTTPVVIISAEDDKQVVLQAITCGAIGFISKSSHRGQMTDALQQILNGNIYLPSDIMHQPNNEPGRRRRNMNEMPVERLLSLTRRQLLVLERMVKGDSNKLIAYNLNIAETTVKAHVSAILSKLGVHSRVQAILTASDIDFTHYLRR
ncbi:MAG: response regulator transcription factor [Marinospirillum sp.]|uniref:response regulator n=1 Tax=Marinospirillum sp. TaxID=2183934 RepID=UPI001A05F68E|nr:response regulator transcription factor [Marinospirillum sp.]MBE0505631.1 response regulator transcription factor [Marinospirillum sp.]